MTGRIVITGIGAVTPFGVGVTPFWEGLIGGHSAVRETTDSDWKRWVPVLADIPAFDYQEFLSKKQIKNNSRFTQLGIIAASEALKDAGYAKNVTDKKWRFDFPSHRAGISVGTAYGGVDTLSEGAEMLAFNPNKRVSPRLLSMSMPNAAGAALAREYGFRGPVMTYTTACASAANAIGEAQYWLKSGKVDMVLAGGSDALFSPVVFSGLHSAGAIATTGPTNKSTWSRPFDANRQGMVAGEGAAFMIMEPYEKAVNRGAKIYAELAGYGTSNDAYHETAPHPEGKGANLAMHQALEEANLQPKEVDYINAHATGTTAGDKVEALALQKVFGEYLPHIPVNSIKGAIGHTLGAAGAVESISCLQSIQTDWLPPTLHCSTPDNNTPSSIILGQAKQHYTTYAMSNSFGFGGQNGVLIWKLVN